MKVRIAAAKPGEADDFLFSAWLSSWSGSGRIRLLGSAGTPARRLITRILQQQPRTVVWQATDEDSRRILAVAVVSGDVLHYVYVREADRQSGLCRAMLADLPRPMACWWLSRGAKYVRRALGGALTFDPLRLMDF